MGTALEKLKRQWLIEHESVRPMSIQDDAILALEDRYEVILPPVFRRYLRTMAPLSHQDGMDDNLLDWWSVDRIKNIPDEYCHKIGNKRIQDCASKYLFFADYCIWSWASAICCQAGPDYGKVVLIGGDDRFVTDSFEAFLELSLVDVDAFL